MIKSITRRFLGMLLAVLMVLTMAPSIGLTAPVYAADGTAVTGLSDEGIGLSYSGDGTWKASGTTIEGSATGTSGCGGGSSTTTTLTITNNKTNEAVLSFAYSASLNSGSINVKGTEIKDESGTFPATPLKAGESITISVKSASDAKTTSIKLTNVSLSVNVDATALFKPAVGGSYTVDGTAVTSETSLTKNAQTGFAVKATEEKGYRFLGWYSETLGKYLSTAAETTLHPESDQTIVPRFASSTDAVFETAGVPFTDLNEAVSYAQSKKADKITLVSDGKITGNYTIPKGITLLIPFDTAGTCYTNKPANVSTSYGVPTKFRELTMAAGSSLTINGALSLSAKHGAAPGSSDFGGSPSGPCSYIKMEKGSNITVNEGGAAYVWGFIYGDGAVTAKSGSLVYENMQITDFRGGGATSGIINTKIFPFNQYYVQNIEVAETLESGANEFVYSSLYAVGSAYSTEVHFVGSNGAMFTLASGSSLVKKYDPASDRLILDVNGDFSINPLSLDVGPASVNSANYNLPITNNITVNINSGKTIINQDVALLPGVEVNIASGAELNVSSGHKLFVYDTAEWNGKNFAGSGDYKRQRYTASARAARSALTDAKIDVNGILSADGSIYTTAGGADITSSKGTGKFVLGAAPGTDTTTQQMAGTSGSATDIAITAARLHNGSQYAGTDEEYTVTAGSAAGDTFGYNKNTDKWEKGFEPAASVSVTFDANQGSGTMENQVMDADTETVLTKNTFTREGYTFDHWNTAADDSGTSYKDEQAVTLKEDTTLYAIWKTNTYTITWKDADGSTLKTDTVNYGEMPEYKGETPAKAADAQYTYTFKGWTPEIAKVTGDAEYTAEYTQTVNTYTVTWKNEDGTVLKTDEKVAYGTAPEYKGDIPTKAADAQNTYVFDGWDPEAGAITGDTVYTAKFKAVVNTYTVTWVNEDGTELEKDENVPYGTTPTYDSAEPTKAADAQYTYTFKGWTPEVAAVAGNVTYKAVYDQTVNKYTVTWKDGDGNVLETDTDVPYGTKPSYDGETPTKAGTAENSYTFTGWDPAIGDTTVVTGDVTYTAQFAAKTNTYTVKWVDEDGTELETDENVPYGTIPTFDVENPTKAADAQYTYTFAGWTPSVDKVTGDVTYTASYDKTVNKYTVTWANENGDVIKTEEVEYGTKPVYSGETPTKAADAQYSYTFAGWTPAIDDTTTVTGDVTYTATFTSATNTYTITWVNEDGTVLETDADVAYGATPEYNGTTPTKAATAQYSYTFAGWTPDVSTVTADATYTAKYTESTNRYKITWKMDDGSVLKEETLDYGAMPAYGDDPTKQGDAQYTYTFKGWNPAPAAVAGDVTYTAQFDKKTNTYTVTWANDDGTVIKKDTVEYGTTPAYEGETPTKEGNAQYTYTFKGWNQEPAAVTADVTYTAVYDQTLNKYTVTWEDADGNVLETDKDVEYGATASYDGKEPTKAEDDQYTYEFSGWNPSDLTVTGDMTFTAVYQGTVKKYKVTWYDEDGTTLLYEDADVAYGQTPVYKGTEPSKESTLTTEYKFTGWDPEMKAITGATTYKAVYQEVNFLDGFTGIYYAKDGTIYYVENGTIDTAKNGLVRTDESTAWFEEEGHKKYAAGKKDIYTAEEYYYFMDGKAVKDKVQWVENTNGLLPQWDYTFDTNGIIKHEDVAIDGIQTVDGVKYYYIDGIRVHMGMFKIGEDYYYAKRDGRLITGASYYCSRMNDTGMKEGTYTFDAEGKLITNTQEDKNGIVAENGSLYYYEHGKLTYAGLIKIDGSYYYVRTSGEVVHDKSYWITKTNDIFPQGSYTFDSDGKMVNPPAASEGGTEVKNGIVSDFGSLYYYVNGKLTYAGLIQIDGSYYYVRTSGEVVHGRKYWITKTNGLMPEASYTFDDTGKMLDPK